jgi:hypothetical protein
VQYHSGEIDLHGIPRDHAPNSSSSPVFGL